MLKPIQFFRGCCLVVATLVSLGSVLSAGNLVRNGNFMEKGAVTKPTPVITRPDNRMPSWSMRADWYIDLKEKAPLQPSAVLRADGAGAGGAQLLQNVYLEPGKTYTLSAWMKARDLVRNEENLGDTRSGVILTNWRWTEKVHLVASNEELKEWKRYSVTFKAPAAYIVAGVEQPCMVRLYLPGAETGTIWVTGIQIEEGSQVSDFQEISLPQLKDAVALLDRDIAHLKSVGTILETFSGNSLNEYRAELKKTFDRAARLKAHIEKTDSFSVKEWEQIETQLDQVEAEVKHLAGVSGWWENPWKDLGEREFPENVALFEERSVRLVLGENDYGALLLPMINLAGKSIPVEIEVGTERAPLSTLTTFNGPIKVSTVFSVSNEGFVSTISPVQGHKQYPLFLNELGNSNTVLLPNGEVSQLWFDVDTRGIEPGEYRYPVKIKALNIAHTWEGEIILEVLPVVLPVEVPTNVIAFSNMPFLMEPFRPHVKEKPILNFTPEERLEIARPWLQAWKDMGFNRLNLSTQYLEVAFNKDGTLREEIDYSVFDAYRELWDSIGGKHWVGYNTGAYHVWSNWRTISKVDEVSKKRMRSLFESFIGHLEKSGLTPDTTPICMFDEPHGIRVDVTRQAVEVLREMGVEWKTISAIAGTRVQHIRDLVPLLDIFVVRQRMGQMDMLPETIEYLKQQGKEVWGYACSGSFEYMNPYRYFRLMPWQSWKNGLNGYGMYMSIDMNGYPEIGARSAYFSPLFLGRDGPVFGKGARAFQLGGRDWSLFTVATQLVDQAWEQGLAEQSRKLDRILHESVERVLKEENNHAVADEVRVNLLRGVVELQNSLRK